MKILLPLFFATIAAIGNSIFAYGQKKSVIDDQHGLIFISLSVFIAFILAFSTSFLFGKYNFEKVIVNNWSSILYSGIGLFLTYIGFFFLYTKFGVLNYALYAVISIITTTLIVGALILKEPINIYHLGAILFSVISIFLFSLAQ